MFGLREKAAKSRSFAELALIRSGATGRAQDDSNGVILRSEAT